jgi:hypothetical protein
MRSFQYKQLRCRWAVSGAQMPVHALVVQMAGDGEPWFLVTSTLDLTAAQVVEVWAARFRQEDGFRDHKQRLGMEACPAWTKEPILRPFQVQLVALTWLHVLQGRVDQAWGSGSWWRKPAWNPRKHQASILDLRRLFWQYRREFSQFLLDLEELGKPPKPHGMGANPTEEAA